MYKCTLFQAFSHPKFLDMHMRAHQGERPYQCDQCDRKFRTACNLGAHKKLKHERTSHSGEKVFTCDECGAGFSQACNLGIHKKKKHSNSGPPPGEKNFVCNICDARFSEACNLGAHKKIKHTEESEKGQTVFECNICHAKFYRECNLAGHKRRKHSADAKSKRSDSDRTKPSDDTRTQLEDDSGQSSLLVQAQQFLCSLCSARFSTKENLEAHQQMHFAVSPAPCHICSILLPDMASLVKHLENHAAERFLQEYDMLSAQN